jgi:hypothetical protein
LFYLERVRIGVGSKVWVVYREESIGYDKIYDDKVYLSREKAEQDAKGLNKGSILKYYVDYLEVDEN